MTATLRNALQRLIPALFVLLWSTGFIGAKYGLPYAEPFTFLSLRFVIVAALLTGIIAVSRAPLPTDPMQIVHLSVAGILVHGLYLGGVFTAISLGVNAAVCALIVCVQPILTAVLVAPLLGEQVSARQWTGFGLGFAGVILVVLRQFSLHGSSLAGLAWCVLALIAITLGIMYQKRFCTAVDLRSGSLVQFIAAAALMLILAFSTETRQVDWNLHFVFALGWVCLVLSLGAITLLMSLIRRGEASQVAGLFYLVPPVVAVQAWLIFGERLGGGAIAGLLLCAIGVALVIRSEPRAD